jgi:hypothetical protein
MYSAARTPRRRRASSSASVTVLPPEPVQSHPHSLHPAHISHEPSSPSSADLPPPSPKSYFPSVLSLLQSTQRYSSYIATGFLSLHALNTCIIPLCTALSNTEEALSKIDNGFMITRFLYRPSESTEWTLVLLPLAVHVLSGLCLRLRKIYLTRNLYGEGILASHARQTRINRSKGLSWPRIRALPTLGYSAIAATGWGTCLLVSLHAYTTRYLPHVQHGQGGETSITLVSHALQTHPVWGYGLYTVMIALAGFHVVSGWGRWLKVTFTQRGRRWKNWIVVAVVGGWLGALVRVGRLEVFSRATRGEYDVLYRRLWGAF